MGQRLTLKQIEQRLKDLPADKGMLITLRGKSGFEHEEAWMQADKLANGKYSATSVVDGESEEYKGSLTGLLALIAEYRRRPRKTAKRQAYMQCRQCGRKEKADIKESPQSAAERLGWKEDTTKTKKGIVEETVWICKNCQNEKGRHAGSKPTRQT